MQNFSLEEFAFITSYTEGTDIVALIYWVKSCKQNIKDQTIQALKLNYPQNLRTVSHYQKIVLYLSNIM